MVYRRLFQSTHPHGVRRRTTDIGIMTYYFNPRTRMGCDGHIRRRPRPCHRISIHAPAWGATYGLPVCNSTAIFQSTHPHGVRPPVYRKYIVPFKFQSTHPHGVRPTARARPPGSWAYFNPRTRMGCDARVMRLMADWLFISIHAPAWGATSWRGSRVASTSYFNPRTRMGCDTPHRQGVASVGISIHAPAWGATQGFQASASALCYFNPRTRMGCDRRRVEARRGGTISIHAPAWGATYEFRQPPRWLFEISIHAPAWGATVIS